MMTTRHPILSAGISLILLVQLALAVGLASCSAAGCVMPAVDGTRLLPACCCDPGNCSGELTQTGITETAPVPAEAQLIPPMSLGGVVFAILSAVPVRPAVDRAPVADAVPAPPLFLLHASFLI